MSTEEMIKQAFERQAGRAGDHRKVLAGVRKATAKRRIGGWGIGLIGIGVAAAVVTPVVLFSDGQPREAAPADPTVTTLPLPAVPKKPAEHAGEGVTVLTYQPSWLPDGAYEQMRNFQADGVLSRMWWAPGGDEQTRITLSFDNQTVTPTGVNTVDINGIPGLTNAGDSPKSDKQAFVVWMVGPGQRLSVSISGLPGAMDTALRIARSVKPDGDAAFEQPLSFDWLPQHMQPGGFMISGTGPKDVDALADTELAPEARGKGQKRVSAMVSGRKPMGGTPVTVRGKQGVFVPFENTYGDVYVELEPGRWLQVGGPLSQQDLVRIADTITIGPLNYPWLGTR